MTRKFILTFAISIASVIASHAAVILDSGSNGISASTFGILNGNSTGKAVGFSLGTSLALGASASSGYSLDSISVRLHNPRASAIAAASYTFSLWSSDGDPSPGTQLATFISQDLTAGATASYNLFVSAPFTLQPSTTYWIVAQSTLTDSGTGSTLPIWWGSGGTATMASGVSLTSPVGRFGSSGAPSTWTSSSGVFNDLQLNATAIPEPSVVMMMIMGTGLLIGRRCRKAVCDLDNVLY